MMQGDQYGLPIEILKEDGSALTGKEVEDVEFFIGPIRKTLKEGEIFFDEEQQAFVAKLMQSDTFMLRESVEVQVRVCFKNGDVIGLDLGECEVIKSLSKVILK